MNYYTHGNDDELYHYGVQGMHWGQHMASKVQTMRKDHAAKSAARKAERAKKREEKTNARYKREAVFILKDKSKSAKYNARRDLKTLDRYDSKYEKLEKKLSKTGNPKYAKKQDKLVEKGQPVYHRAKTNQLVADYCDRKISEIKTDKIVAGKDYVVSYGGGTLNGAMMVTSEIKWLNEDAKK